MHRQPSKPWILLDRDGVINEESDAYIKTPEEWHAIPGSLQAIARLNRAGFGVAVVSNQAGVGRGLFSMEMLEQIHAKMHRELAAVGGHLDGLYFCPHHPDDHCECRKPKTGLLLRLSQELDVDLHKAIFVGDTSRDLEVARAVGSRPILVRTGYGERTLQQNCSTEGIEVTDDLAAAVDGLLGHL